MLLKVKRWIHSSTSHERSIGHGDFFYNSVNDSIGVNAITGSPISSIDLDNTIKSEDDDSFNSPDQSQFHETNVSIITNDVLEATCGNLNQE